MPKEYKQQWKDQVYLLKKALYGLKKSPRLWYKRLAEFLFTQLGLHQIHADHSIFVTSERVCGPIITTFVDDLNIFAPRGSGIISQIKSELAAAFDMVDIRLLTFYVGLKVT